MVQGASLWLRARAPASTARAEIDRLRSIWPRSARHATFALTLSRSRRQCHLRLLYNLFSVGHRLLRHREDSSTHRHALGRLAHGRRRRRCRGTTSLLGLACGNVMVLPGEIPRHSERQKQSSTNRPLQQFSMTGGP